MNPDVQQEILDEIDEVCAGVTNIQDVKYEDMFNKLTKTSSILVSSTILKNCAPELKESFSRTKPFVFSPSAPICLGRQRTSTTATFPIKDEELIFHLRL